MPCLWLSSFATVAALLFSSAAGSDAGGGQVWYVDITAGGANDGTSWADAFNDLQDALDIAQGGDEIWVVAGTYTPDRGTGDRSTTFQLVSGVGLYGGFADWETRRDEREPVVNQTILSGDLASNDGPRDCAEHTNCCTEHEELGCDDPTCEAFVCELAPGCCDPLHYPFSWNVTCTEYAEWACCHLGSWNSCENAYQVVTATATDASTVVDGFTISAAYSCYARDGDVAGFGMFCEGGALTIANCTFTGNAYDGLYSRDSSDLTLANCTFIDNVGAGFAALDSNVTLADCRFMGNGEGMYGRGNANLSNCTFRDNRGKGLDFSGDTTLTNCMFTGNSAGLSLGGGRRSPRGQQLRLYQKPLAGHVEQRLHYDPDRLPVSRQPQLRAVQRTRSRRGNQLRLYGDHWAGSLQQQREHHTDQLHPQR